MRARDNPFRVEQIHRLSFRPQGFSWSDILCRLKGFEYRAAVVGAEGTGKTTFLDHLAPRLETIGFAPKYVRVGLDCGNAFLLNDLFPTLPPHTILLVDGTESLNRFAWMRFQRSTERFAGCIVTLHAKGRMPTLIETATNNLLFRELVQELVGEEVAQEAAGELDRLFAACRGNVREALRSCYDAYATRGTLLGAVFTHFPAAGSLSSTVKTSGSFRRSSIGSRLFGMMP